MITDAVLLSTLTLKCCQYAGFHVRAKFFGEGAHMKKRGMMGKWSLPLAFLGMLLLLQGCSVRPLPQRDSGEGLELTVLHTNDIHSHIAGVDKYGNACFEEPGCRGGMGRIAAAIRSAKTKNDNVIALDAGDQFQGTLFYSVNKWPMLAEVDAHMPYDAMTLGNHEFDEGCADAGAFTRSVPFPVLAANLAPKQECPMRHGRTKPYIIRRIRGVPVGIIGIANDEVVELAAACPFTGFEKAENALSRAVKELEGQGVRHIIALTHLGLPEDRRLARAVEGIDVIVGGHTHSFLGPGSEEGPYPIVERSPEGNPVLVVTAKRAAVYLGELHVAFDTSGVPVRWSGGPVELAPDAPSDPRISPLIAKFAGTLEEYRRSVVGSHNLSLPDGMDACRAGECLGGMVMADAMLAYGRPYGAAIALCNGGGIRAALPAGKITRGDLLSMLPFGGSVVVRKLDGKQVLEALEHGVSQEGAKGPRLLQAAGLRYVVNPAGRPGGRVKEVMVADAMGKSRPLDASASYLVVLPDFLARGGDGYAMFAKSAVVPSPEPLDVDIVESWIRKHSPLPMTETGRIVYR